MDPGDDLIGRETESALVAGVLRDSAAGRASALVVSGEPGVGKTRLVAAATSGTAAQRHLVLWGRCLRFGAESSPYLPITQLLTHWHRQATETERVQVLAGAEHLAAIAPALGDHPGPIEKTRVVSLVTTVIDRIAANRPVVLVLDDIQWADVSSLDLLAYLLAGFAPGQRVGVLATLRDTELGEGHPLHGWLADVARFPGVSRLRLEPLGLADVEDLVAQRRPGEDALAVAAELFARAGGNPYYTELLLRGDGAAGVGGTGHDGLRQALLSTWHALPPQARELLQLLAIGGRPVAVDILERLWTTRRGTSEVLATSLSSASSTGLVNVDDDGEAWFHHPLVAEVIASTVPPSLRRSVHRQYVEVVERATDLATTSRAAHLALHHDAAGNVDDAFRWSLRAAAAAEEVRGHAEVASHLHRACQLWERVDQATRRAVGGHTELWRRASEACWSAGEHVLAVNLREDALAALGPDDDPLLALRLELPLFHWHVLCGTGRLSQLQSARKVLAAAEARSPGSAEHAQALARMAFAEVWAGRPVEALAHASSAVRLARRVGVPDALAWALSMQAHARPDPRKGLRDALRAVALTEDTEDRELIGVAAVAGANCYERLGLRAEAAQLLLTTFRRLLDVGSVHDAMWALPEFAAMLLVDLGRWTEARDVLRELLGRRHAAHQAAQIRGVAAVLAFRSGDSEAARTHLARARELTSEPLGPGQLLAHIEVEALWAEGRPEEAVALATDLMSAMSSIDPGGADELMVAAARAAADLAAQPGRRPDAVAALDRLVELRGPDAFRAPDPCDLLHPALGDLFAAERTRCRGEQQTAAPWTAAVAACARAGMPWHEALASLRRGRALLGVRGGRPEAASALRHAAALASALGATPVLEQVRSVAQQARISLEEREDAHPPPADVGITPREREVLSLVVAGRTYAEIAGELFISEKTVSVHVSNLLRKTGTSSRIELAELARRG